MLTEEQVLEADSPKGPTENELKNAAESLKATLSAEELVQIYGEGIKKYL